MTGPGLLADRPLVHGADDLLGFESLSDGIADLLAATREGGWLLALRARDAGAGRTSFLNLLHAALHARGVSVTRCQGDASALVASLADLPQQLWPIVLADDAGHAFAAAMPAHAMVVAALPPGASHDGAALVLDLPPWSRAAASDMASRHALSEALDSDERAAWIELLAAAATPRQARRRASAGHAAVACTRAPRADVLRSLADSLDGRCVEAGLDLSRFIGACDPSAWGEPRWVDAPDPMVTDLVGHEPTAHCDSPTPRQVADLARVLAEGPAQSRLLASQSLAQISTTEAAPLLRPLLRSDDADVRRAIAGTLGRLGDEDSRDGVMELLGDPSADSRAAAAAALGRLGGAAALDPLFMAMGDAHARVRLAAETALAHVLGNLPEGALSIAALGGRKDTMDALAPLLLDARAPVRLRAAEALGLTADVRAIDPLLAAHADGDADMRRIATASLVRLGYGKERSQPARR